MCTLSVLARREGGYLLAMNRDERVTRGIADPPRLVRRGAVEFLAPRDSDAGGTWIAVDRAGRTLCLMNGDRSARDLEPIADATSRGTLVPELMADPSPAAVERVLRERLASGTLRFLPFQLVAVAADGDEPGDVNGLAIAFDGRELVSRSHAAPFVLTSNGFDPESVARWRTARFAEFLATARELDDAALKSALLELHASHSPESPEGSLLTICMHRPEVRSVSTTVVEVSLQRVTMHYRSGQPCHGAPVQEFTIPASVRKK